MSPLLRKLNLTAHVVSSVGWLGAVVAFLALSIAGLAGTDPSVVRASYVAMNVVGQFTIVPLSILALTTGVIQSLGTHWGLARHYWVLTKFALTVGATLLLLLHQFTAVAGAARRVSVTGLPDVGRLGSQLVFDAAFATLVLVAAATLSVYKPWGPIRMRKAGTANPAGVRVAIAIAGALVAAIIVLHLTGHGLGGHT